VTIGDMATTRLDRTFRLAYLVFNTITNLTAQQEQVRCFQNAADHLEPGGRFVIEVFVPELRRLPPGDAYRAFTVTPTHLGFDEYDGSPPSAGRTTGSSGRLAAGLRVDPPVRVAGGDGPDGTDGRPLPRGPLGRLAPRAVHGREHHHGVGLAHVG
jgi:hypothetical protein